MYINSFLMYIHIPKGPLSSAFWVPKEPLQHFGYPKGPLCIFPPESILGPERASPGQEGPFAWLSLALVVFLLSAAPAPQVVVLVVIKRERIQEKPSNTQEYKEYTRLARSPLSSLTVHACSLLS